MFQYLLQRIFLFLPTLLLASLLAFALSTLAPGDPVLDYLNNNPYSGISRPAHLLEAENTVRNAAKILQHDLPPFYFSVTSQAYPDTLHLILLKSQRKTLQRLIARYGNWAAIERYYRSIRSMELQILALPDSLNAAAPFKQALRDLYHAHEPPIISSKMAEMENTLQSDSLLHTALSNDFFSLKNHWEKVQQEATPGKLRIPAFHWHGVKNRYHVWLSGFVRGDFGVSIAERIPAAKKIKSALFWTLVVNIGAILLAYLLSVPLGVYSAVKKGKPFDRATSLGLFMLYSLPGFWLATLALIFLTTREYGMDWFDTGLNHVPVQAPWYQKIALALPNLVLPMLCIALPALAFIARQMRGSMVAVLEQDYIRTARSKGLPERQVIWRHGFRNALFPLITIFGSVLPSAIGGSVAVELIFNIPGMGWLTLQAIGAKDWNVVFAILMLGSFLTVLGMLLADLLYAWADPRVKLGS